ncbi:MAG: cyanophycin synthetase [Candidatus Sericytochromatia bacterium]
MKILETRVLRGPNIWSAKPCFLAVIDLEDLHDQPTTAFPGFTDRLLALLPGQDEHGWRLREGTHLAHAVEHLLLALQHAAGIDVGFGQALAVPNRVGHFAVAVAYESEKVVEDALPIALRAVEGLVRGETVALRADLEELAYWAQRQALGPSTRAIVEAARRRDIPLFRVTEDASLFQLGWGKHQQRIRATMTSHTSDIAVDLASDKDLTKALLAEAGLPVPRGEIVRTPEAAVRAAMRLGGAVAVKPLDGNQGKGVSLNLTTPEQVTAAFELATQYRRSVLVERFVEGQDYRVLVVGDLGIAAARRLPAQVTGDGARSVRALVDQENQNPLRGEGHEKPMTRIKLDEGARQVLDRQGLNVDSVPEAGRVVVLKENANLSTGGTAEDVTDLIHPRNAAACVRAARKIGLDVAGIDVVCHDISQPFDGQRGAIIEVNAAPGIRMHQHPCKGQAHDVGAAIVNALFPPGAPSRIPTIAVTGTNGKTTTTLLTGHVIQATGTVTGVTTTEGIYVNGRLISEGDCTGYWSARTVLTDPSVEAAVLETARGGMFKRGLAFDACDVGVVLNIHDDHLGQHGAETLEDMANVKSLVVRHARQAVVLNADDPIVAQMDRFRQEGTEVLYVSMNPSNPVLNRHLDEGGRAVYLRRNMVMLADNDHRIPLIEVERIPFTYGGRARHNVTNTLASVAALWAIGQSTQSITAGLETFTSNVDQNPGRLNLFQVRDFQVLLDYAHNADSYKAIIDTARRFPHHRLIGLVTAPGDRYDEKLHEIGRICGTGFDHVVIRDTLNRRGRAVGEVPKLLMTGAREAGVAASHLEVVLDTADAIERALAIACEGDIVVIGSADNHEMLPILARHVDQLVPPQGPGISISLISEPETEAWPSDQPQQAERL